MFHIGPGKVEEMEIFLWSELLPEARNVRCPQLLLPLPCLPVVMAPSPSSSHGPLSLSGGHCSSLI